MAIFEDVFRGEGAFAERLAHSPAPVNARVAEEIAEMLRGRADPDSCPRELSIALAAGAALAGDIAAEVESLRAEMDQLKRAFRQALAGGVISRDERPMIVAEALVQVDHLLEMRDRLDMRQSAMAPDELWSDDDASWDIEQ